MEQVRLLARDNGVPQLVSETATIRVRVYRNKNAPRFNQREYYRQMDPDWGTGTEVVTASARDDDNKVGKYNKAHNNNHSINNKINQKFSNGYQILNYLIAPMIQ